MKISLKQKRRFTNYLRMKNFIHSLKQANEIHLGKKKGILLSDFLKEF